MTKISSQEILNNFTLKVIPAFSKSVNSSQKGVFDPPEQIGEKEEWKDESVIEILQETIEAVEEKDFASAQHLFFPPIITLIQDHQVKYKMIGINLLKIVGKKSQNLREIGLEKLFLKELSSCLTWHSNPELVQLSMQVLLDFIFSHDQNYSELENVLNDVLRGLVYSLGMNDQVQIIFLNALIRLIPEIGILALQFTKSFIVSVSDVLMIATELDVIRTALILLEIVIKHCWIRIPKLKGVILTSVAESFLISKDSEENLKFYQKVLKALQDCCDLKDDLLLLSQMRYYDRLLEPLLS